MSQHFTGGNDEITPEEMKLWSDSWFAKRLLSVMDFIVIWQNIVAVLLSDSRLLPKSQTVILSKTRGNSPLINCCRDSAVFSACLLTWFCCCTLHSVRSVHFWRNCMSVSTRVLSSVCQGPTQGRVVNPCRTRRVQERSLVHRRTEHIPWLFSTIHTWHLHKDKGR